MTVFAAVANYLRQLSAIPASTACRWSRAFLLGARKVAGVGLFFAPAVAAAQPAVPTAAHPRLFLDNTTVQKLRLRASGQTREWQLFQQYLRTYLTEDPWGGQFVDGIAAFALGYQVTGDTVYAERALNWLRRWVEELNVREPFEVSGDDYAHTYAAVGLGFDWLYPYRGFGDSLRQAVIATMNRVYTYGQTSWNQGGGDFEVDPHDSDQIIGGALTAFVWGTATSGDNPSAEAMVQHGRNLWHKYITNWIRAAIGGVWPEGSQYSYNTLYLLFAFTEAERSASGRDPWVEEGGLNTFVANALRALLYLTVPSNDHILTYGDQEDDNAHYWLRRNHAVALMAHAAERLGFREEAAWARYWIRELSPDNLDMNLWKLFLWFEPDKPRENYFQGELPWAYFADGTDWLFFRSNWTPQCTYGTFSAMWTDVDHQFCDGGNFTIWRNGEYLTRQVRHYDFVFQIDGKQQRYDGEASNILLIQSDYVTDDEVNAMGSPEYFASAGEPAITRYRVSTSPRFVYALADLGQSYNRVHDEWGGNSDRVVSYTRQFVHLVPDIFLVYDRSRTKDPGWAKYVLHAVTEPRIRGNKVIQFSESGRQVLVNRTLWPEHTNISVVNEAEVWNRQHGLVDDWMIPESERRWHVLVRPADADSVNLLNVIEVADVSDTARMEEVHCIRAAAGIGAQVGKWVVLFALREKPMGAVRYHVQSSTDSVFHLVCDLVSDQAYDVYANDDLRLTARTGRDGTLFFRTGPVDSVSVEQTSANTRVGTSAPAPGIFALEGIYPSPFNASTQIAFNLGKAGVVRLTVVDVLGRRMYSRSFTYAQSGHHVIRWEGRDDSGCSLPTGVYLIRLETSGQTAVRKVALVR